MLWANAIVLGLGGALLALPILLHLLMQPKAKVLEFPALKFVRQIQFANRSRLRLKHFLLLMLRCLLILCMAAALAGPSVASREFGQWVTLGGVAISALVVLIALLLVWFGSAKPNQLLLSALSILLLGHLAYGGWATTKLLNSDSAQLIGDSAAPVTALILIDNSCRMEYNRENKTNLERAKEIGDWLISQFPADSQVCVLATDNEVPFYSVDLGAAENRLNNLETGFQNVSLPGRVAEWLELLDEAVHERKEIYIVTDLSKRSWDDSVPTLATELAINPAIAVFVIDVGQDEPANFTLAPLELNTESITRFGELEISTAVGRSGEAAQRNVRFRLELPDETRPVVRDGEVLLPDQFIERVQTVDIREDSSSPVSFKFSGNLPLGVHHGRIEIVGDDSLAVDDTRYFTIEVVESWDLLVVHPENITPDNFTLAVTDDLENSLFNCKVVQQTDLPSRLDPFDAVFFLDPTPQISETMWVMLQDYVRSGHGLGIFLGANAADGGVGHENFKSEAAQKILTGKLKRQWRRPEADLFVSPDNLVHPIFAPFRSWETAVPWNQFPIFTHWGLEPDEDWEQLPTQTILRYGNGQSAIIERQLGDGRIIIMTTPITESENVEGRRSWNSLFTGVPLPAWLLVRQISQYLVQSQSDRINLIVGDVARLKNDFRRFPNDYRIFTPRTQQTPEKLSAVEGSVRYRFTDSPGQYRLKGQLERPVLRGFSVNLANGETDLTRIEPAEIDAMLGAGRYQLATQQNQIQRQQGTTRRGQEFYSLLLLILVVVMGVEYLLSNRFYS